jgi:transposase InsO family protein
MTAENSLAPRKPVKWVMVREISGNHMNRQPPPGLVHHSDQGVQYRCGGYLQVLRNHRMVASVSRPGYPYDNASCESFMKTLKREEICAHDYRDLEHLLESVEGFIENYYNRCRLHSALGYRSPGEFENESEDRNGDASFGAATMRIFKTLTGTQT